MGSSVENPTVAGEIPNVALLVNGDTTEGKAPQEKIGAFTDGYVLWSKPDWALTGENISINELLPTDATPGQDRCLLKKNSLIS